ncbi:MAG TPA: hypothetical protein VGH27_29970 [Streptosporangiaceae bacterium]|jgi:alpha-beta hydrolase superfamily lysophospholipase
MTLSVQPAPELSWNEPDGLAPRGTLVVIPGRGEQPVLYERLGRRLSADAYRVHATVDPATDAEQATAQVAGLLSDAETIRPRVLVGSDTGALFVAGLAATGQVTGIDAIVLAGLPATPENGADSSTRNPRATNGSWDAELDARTACPTHRRRLAGPGLRRGALADDIPADWFTRADLGRVNQPVLGLHGADDPVSPLATVLPRYAAAPSAELVSIAGGRHDVLNDQTHRTTAATVVLFLERLRLGSGLRAIAVSEPLTLAAVPAGARR